ncbi:hypothetical protein N7U66_18820 [Lacinutrix neustonica]|uniref:Uncharacterized protein n=1 Tax=Lacinutrix neustonica TaxID=2980107 RepID=A0A9E8MWI1_9FLAO|nr:hypothetical protein [Lacinutrix neustonica]WAC01887.1 hypothetical protein N7U66_18820 [Lacinutrix neustonica]
MMLTVKQDTFKLKLIIEPNYYTQPRKNYNNEDSGNIIYTDRDSLYQCLKKKNEISKPCKSKSDLQYFDEANYKIEEFPKDKKNILGYKCFKIIAKRNDEYLKHTYEMYVTDKIKLDFNYLINFKSLNSKYLILELKRTTPMEGNYYGYITNSIKLD